MLCKNQLHELRGPLDVIGTDCRGCYNNRMHRRDDKRRLAKAIYDRLMDAGLKEADLRSDSGFALALKWTASAADDELAALEQAHPALVMKLRTQLARLDSGYDAYVASR